MTKKSQLIALVSRSDQRVDASMLFLEASELFFAMLLFAASSFTLLRLDAAREKRYKSPMMKRGSSVRNARR